jgi:hypothetical protein
MMSRWRISITAWQMPATAAGRGGGAGARLNRITARIVPDGMTEVPVALAHGRLVVLGPTTSACEELIFAGGSCAKAGSRVSSRSGG